jgi:hypothetical protein
MSHCTSPDDIKELQHLEERELAVKTEATGENLPYCHFVRHKAHMTVAWD